MKILLYLYPKSWRERYGEEFLYLLEQQKLSVKDVVDIIVNAFDTRLVMLLEEMMEMKIVEGLLGKSLRFRFIFFGILIVSAMTIGYLLSRNVINITAFSTSTVLLMGVGLGIFLGYAFGFTRGVLRVVRTAEGTDVLLPKGILKFERDK